MKKTVVLFLICVSFSASAFAQRKPGSANISKASAGAAVPCGASDAYSVVTGQTAGAKSVKILRRRQLLKTIRLPNQSQVNGFSLNWAKKTKAGFEISIEYGSRYYYEKRFEFVCRGDKFYLHRIRTKSFDKSDPEKWKNKQIAIKPNLPLEKFAMTDFTVD